MKSPYALLVNLLLVMPVLSAAQTRSPVKPQTQPSHICTTAPRSEWLPQEEMKLLAEHRGYRIKTFKLAKGDCYEIYGFDKEGHIVEAYFNPVTSQLVRQNVAK